MDSLAIEPEEATLSASTHSHVSCRAISLIAASVSAVALIVVGGVFVGHYTQPEHHPFQAGGTAMITVGSFTATMGLLAALFHRSAEPIGCKLTLLAVPVACLAGGAALFGWGLTHTSPALTTIGGSLTGFAVIGLVPLAACAACSPAC